MSLISETTLEVGVGYGDHPGWRMRTVDVSEFGNITGIWEIGPIVSLDRWIPDVLATELSLDEPPVWLQSFRKRQRVLNSATEATQDPMEELFQIDPPDTRFAYYIDYAVFHANGPDDIEHLSDDFNVPGFLADQKYYVEGNGICETHSHPGHMTVTLLGHNSSWAMCPILRDSGIDFSVRKPPFEIETSFIGPGDDAPWNLWWNVGVFDQDETFHQWQPGLKFIPAQGVQFFDLFNVEPDQVSRNESFGLEFDSEFPELPPGGEPIGMLIQVPDEYRLRIGFRADAASPWVFSSTFDARSTLGRITKFGYPCLVSFQGRGVGGKGWGTGNYPNYQKFRIDYIHFRYGLTE